jgi:hypothetical protein
MAALCVIACGGHAWAQTGIVRESVMQSFPGSSGSPANNSDGSTTYSPRTFTVVPPADERPLGSAVSGSFVVNVNADAASGERTQTGTVRYELKFDLRYSGPYQLDVNLRELGYARCRRISIGCGKSALSLTRSARLLVEAQVLADDLRFDGIRPENTLNADCSEEGMEGELKFSFLKSVQVPRSGTGRDIIVLQWNVDATATSDSCPAAVRFGANNETTTGCDECVYPGDPSRDRSKDGFFFEIIYRTLPTPTPTPTGTATITPTPTPTPTPRQGPFCGDGRVDAGEQCDGGGCCTGDCQFQPAGTTCTDDGNACTADTCNGTSAVCQHPAAFCPVPLCTGDCNGDGIVAINELVLGVNISLESLALAACPDMDANRGLDVTVDELVQGVGNAIHGCPMLNIAPEASVNAPRPLSPVSNAVDNRLDTVWVQDALSPYIALTWLTPREVNRIRVYDHPSLDSWWAEGTLTFSDGSTIKVRDIPNDGSLKEVVFPPRTITSVRFDLDSNLGVEGEHNGLAEFQVFATSVMTDAVIDLSHSNERGVSFGSLTNEQQRYQTFVAGDFPHLTRVRVKIRRAGQAGGQSDVVAQLFRTFAPDGDHQPMGDALATAVLSASQVPATGYAQVDIPLEFSLERGAEYALVLGQMTPSDAARYEWAVGEAPGDDYFGKIQPDGTIVEENELANGWLQVHMSR